MRQGRALSIASLLLTVLLLPMVSGADSTVSVNTTWSGNMVLSGNVTVASGATLTVSPGASIDAKDYSIVVEGTMVANQAHFYSSTVPETQGSHGQGLWSGIEVLRERRRPSLPSTCQMLPLAFWSKECFPAKTWCSTMPIEGFP